MATEKVTEKFDFLTKEKEIQALNDKIQTLEIELAKAKKAARKQQQLKQQQNLRLEHKQRNKWTQ